MLICESDLWRLFVKNKHGSMESLNRESLCELIINRLCGIEQKLDSMLVTAEGMSQRLDGCDDMLRQCTDSLPAVDELLVQIQPLSEQIEALSSETRMFREVRDDAVRACAESCELHITRGLHPDPRMDGRSVPNSCVSMHSGTHKPTGSPYTRQRRSGAPVSLWRPGD